MKTSSPFNLGKARLGVGWGSRDVDLHGAPEHVTDDAQARLININTSGNFDFKQQQRGRLLERPSTSAGPSSHSSRRREAERKEAKDGLHFNPLAAHGKGTTFYNFPLPGSPPTPDQTPPPPPQKSSLATPQSYTPDSMEITATNMQVLPMEIGMALGSPSHQPTDWQAQTRFPNVTRSPSPDMMDDSTDGLVAPPKPKASRWKILGGIFGGRKNSASQGAPFYQLQPEAAQVVDVPEADLTFGEPTPVEKRPKSRGRERAQSQQKASKKKPDMKRSNTAPLQFGFPENGQQTTTPQITLDGGPLVDNFLRSDEQGNPYHGQMLDVNIPSVQMERYSVMFGSVLQKPTNSSSSLLARRQATLDKLKTVNEALISKVSRHVHWAPSNDYWF
jgi:hypothetical protein